VKSGETKVSGAVMIGQPLTLVADWYGECEHYSAGDSKEDPFKGSWSKGTCGTVTTFDLVVKCSLPCVVGRQWVDMNTVYREVTPQHAGKLTLDVTYTTPFHHDKHLTYDVTVRAAKSVWLVGCANQKKISLDPVLLAPPGQPVPWQPLYCKKLDEEAEGSLRVVALTTDDQEMFMQITAPGLYKPLQMELSITALEKLFGPALEFGVYPVRIEVMGKPIDLHVDVRERMQRAESAR
jgi:hypothetical protein